MLRRMLVITLVILVLSGSALLPGFSHPAAAQSTLSIWLYNNDTGQLVNVIPDQGVVNQKSFPLLPDVSVYPSVMTVSPDGRYLAVCMIDNGGNTSIRVYDLNGNLDQVSGYIHGPAMACTLEQYSFSQDGSMLAFGLLNHYPNESNDTRPGWELIVMGVEDSSILYRLDSNSPLFPGGGEQYAGMVPLVAAFDTTSSPGVIAFRPVMWATEGAQEYNSLVWNLGENSLVETGPYGKTSLDLLLGPSEAVWLEIDPALPQGTIMGPAYPFNVVMYSNKMGQTYPIFHNATVLFNTSFVDDGRKIAVQSFNEPGPAEWVYADRDGTQGSLSIASEVYDLWGTHDGLVYLNNTTQATGPELHRYQFAGSALQDAVIWSGQPGEFWRILWVTPFAGNPGLPAFMPIGDTGGNPPVLVVGGRAQVHTTEGDPLRVRFEPGFGGEVAFFVTNGTSVTLLEGPVLQADSSWWLIQLADGRSGWAVEGVMDNGVYLQTLVPIP